MDRVVISIHRERVLCYFNSLQKTETESWHVKSHMAAIHCLEDKRKTFALLWCVKKKKKVRTHKNKHTHKAVKQLRILILCSPEVTSLPWNVMQVSSHFLNSFPCVTNTTVLVECTVVNKKFPWKTIRNTYLWTTMKLSYVKLGIKIHPRILNNLQGWTINAPFHLVRISPMLRKHTKLVMEKFSWPKWHPHILPCGVPGNFWICLNEKDLRVNNTPLYRKCLYFSPLQSL